MTKTIYTVMFGDEYKLQDPTYINKNWEHICFTDNKKIKSDVWDIIYLPKPEDPQKKSREIKLLYYEYIVPDINIYIDSKFKINVNLDKFVKKNLKKENDICLMKHNKRDCLFDEGKFCIKNNIGNKEIIQKQLDDYKKEGMINNFGLFAPGIMIRRDNEIVRQFMYLWYLEIRKYTYRDQISFPYIQWKYDVLNINTINFKETYRAFK